MPRRDPLRDTVEIPCRVIGETYLAIRIETDETTAWIPRSQIKDRKGPKNALTAIFIPEWLAKERGLI